MVQVEMCNEKRKTEARSAFEVRLHLHNEIKWLSNNKTRYIIIMFLNGKIKKRYNFSCAASSQRIDSAENVHALCLVVAETKFVVVEMQPFIHLRQSFCSLYDSCWFETSSN